MRETKNAVQGGIGFIVMLVVAFVAIELLQWLWHIYVIATTTNVGG